MWGVRSHGPFKIISFMNIVVTGASAGIGFELVLVLLEDKRVNNVVAIGRRADRLADLQQRADALGASNRLMVLPSDVMQVHLGQMTQHMSRVDVLINNAGLLKNAPFEELTDDDFQQVYQTNVLAPARLIRQLLPVMGGARPGHIVNIGSMGGVQGSAKFPGLSAYSSSKSALAGLTECLAEEFKERNIRVNCLALGAVQTEMLAQAFPDFAAPVTALEMASYVAEFALSAHRYYNGKVLQVSCTTP
jgi:NAD(P)-dependent dehydrogenase (short-subunit alcohol dehydrogenase family)